MDRKASSRSVDPAAYTRGLKLPEYTQSDAFSSAMDAFADAIEDLKKQASPSGEPRSAALARKIIRALARHGKPMTVAELTAIAGVADTTITTRLVDYLESRKYVRTTRDRSGNPTLRTVRPTALGEEWAGL